MSYVNDLEHAVGAVRGMRPGERGMIRARHAASTSPGLAESLVRQGPDQTSELSAVRRLA
jgi:hypothetical protein